jgi:arsenate reductase
MSDRPTVLYACVHNSGRSVAAQVLTHHYAGDTVEVLSAGSEPGTTVNPAVAQVLSEQGLSVADHVPTLLDPELVQGSDVVVTMGCGETCPFYPGKRYEDWQVEDPAGQNPDTVRRIVADVDARVRQTPDRRGAQAGATCPPVHRRPLTPRHTARWRETGTMIIDGRSCPDPAHVAVPRSTRLCGEDVTVEPGLCCLIACTQHGVTAPPPA